ncbi:hypothetical protein Thiowin_02379 [Thiorhodovibrio winogradskyi]|uniref:DUF3553 domain-containing protein n=1 Tax=Thiorhodovibrio winogradskyi TaxID=77007 RepID=A0ABZ0S8X5_9GAMM|nr:DUF3553 domain-containing protein [Thiorhodovibrio winogradskyi]
MDYQVGDRVKHPKKPEWGLGEIRAIDSSIVTIQFVEVGEKKLSLQYVDLQRIQGEESVNLRLDALVQEKKNPDTKKYKIGRIPEMTAQRNIKTWSIVAQKLAEVSVANYYQLVSWAKGHDDGGGGGGFIDYCITNGWLVPAPTEPVHSSSGNSPGGAASQNFAAELKDAGPEAVKTASATADDSVLAGYIHGFFGYGSLAAPIWFVGMEEGVGDESLEDRLNAWRNLGEGSLLDIRAFHERIGETRWFSMMPRIQKTWRRLISISLAYLDEARDKEDIRMYQRARLATATEALLELMPLPHQKLPDWSHKNLFSSKADYLHQLAPHRVAWLKRQIAEHSPKAVVMYGVTPPYPDYWESIAGGPLELSKQGWFSLQSGQTIFIACQHPVSYGVMDDYFSSIGAFIREGCG